jgi:nucleoside-diphosphate kinase
MERTLVLLKPDAVQRGLVGEVISRFEKVGLKIVGMKMVSPDKDHYHYHYETIGKVISRRGQEVFDMNLDSMMLGPVIAIVLEGIEAADLVRKMVGATEPKSALPGTIRGDFAHMSYGHGDSAKVGIPNIVHASGDANEAKLEIAHWFSGAELFEYPVLHETFTQKGKDKK